MFVIYLIAAAIAIAWGTLFVLRGSLTAGCLAYVVVSACLGYDFFHAAVGPVTITLDRLILPLLVVTYVVQWRLGRIVPRPITRTDLVLGAFLGLLALSTLWGEAASGQGKSDLALRLVSGYLIPGLVYWIARQSPLGRREVAWIHATFAVLGVYLAITGLMEISGQWWAVFPKHIADPKIGLHFGRARGPMVHGVNYGLYLAVCLLAAWAWRWRLGQIGRMAILVLTPLMLAGIYFSYTRSVWIGTALGVVILLGFTLQGTWRPLVLGGLVCGGILLAVTRMDKLVAFNREQSAADTGKSVDLRGNMAFLSWKMFLDRPLFGFGFDQFTRAKLDYLSDRSSDFNLASTRPYVHHNTLLSLLTETGAVGLALFLVVLAVWGMAGWRLTRGRSDLPPPASTDATKPSPDTPGWMRAQGVLMLGVLAVYLCQAVFHELSYLPIDNTLVFFLAGVTVGLVPRESRQ